MALFDHIKTKYSDEFDLQMAGMNLSVLRATR